MADPRHPSRSRRRPLVLLVTIAIGLLGLLPLACGPAADESHEKRTASSPGAKNVVLITFDTTRADVIGCYGGPDGITPNVDRLAAGGVRFARAHASVPLTLPSHTTILSGLEPFTHGVRDNGLYHVPESIETLPELLAATGFDTAAFVSSYVLDSQFGLGRGFARYDDRTEQDEGHRGAMAERDASAVTDAALRWLESRTSPAPFFLWLHYFDPHHPYDPPAPFAARFPEQPYHGEVAYADAELGRVLDALDRRGLTDRTLIVFTSDHGEGLGDHGEPTHGHFLYESTIHVPLIFSHPSLRAGKAPDVAARHIDVAPTILSWLGVTIPSAMQGDALLGAQSGSAESGSTEPGARRETIAYSESELPRIQFGFQPLRAVTDGRLKLISGPHDELYDLTADRAEKKNLAAEMPDRVAAMRRRIEQMIASAATTDATHDADRATMSRIEGLGYSGGDATAEVTTAEWTNESLLEMIRLRNDTKTFLTSGQTNEAIASARQLVTAAPRSHVGLELLGTALSEAGRFDEALPILEKAVTLQPRLPEAQWNIAVCYAQTGRLQEAMDQCRKVVAIDPHHLAANQKLAEQALSEKDLAAARRHLHVLIDYGGTSPVARWARQTLGRIDR